MDSVKTHVYSKNNTLTSEGKTEVEQAIFKLKNSIQDIIDEEQIYSNDFYLLRWLVGNIDLKKAEKYLRATAKWRKEYEIPPLFTSYPDGLLESTHLYLDALTPDGMLVGTQAAGLIDYRGMFEKYGRKSLVKYIMQSIFEVESVLLDINKKNFEGKALTQQMVQGVLMIIDLDKFEARQLRSIEGIQAVIEICKYLVKYFPYLCTRMIVINCTTVGSIVMKILRPILEGPRWKIDVYGTNRSEWQDVITSVIPPHLLRESFGGTKSEEGNFLRTKIIDRDSLLLSLEKMVSDL